MKLIKANIAGGAGRARLPIEVDRHAGGNSGVDRVRADADVEVAAGRVYEAGRAAEAVGAGAALARPATSSDSEKRPSSAPRSLALADMAFSGYHR